MQVTINDKKYTINDKQIDNLMKNLDLTKEEAIQTYLEDEGILENAEQTALDKKATIVYKKENRVTKTAGNKKKKPKTTKLSAEKKEFSEKIYNFLTENYENVEIIKKNKLFTVKINGKILKLDIIEQRPPKN
jgi:hypothetical protein